MRRILLHITTSFAILTASTLFFVCLWSSNLFGVDLEAIIFTLTSPLKGADTDVIGDAAAFCIPRILAIFVPYVIFAVFDICHKKRLFKFDLLKIVRRAVAVISVCSIFASILYANSIYKLSEYFRNHTVYTNFYEEYYVSPKDMDFTLKTEDGKQKNLLYIYLESMETTYASVEVGGEQDINYLKNLTKLAEENVSFSDSELLGGFHNTRKSGYTMGSLLSTTSGIPFSFPTGYNDMDNRETFASGLTTLGDVLYDLGYTQEFLCGSDGSYAGRKLYFTQHGNYEVFDLFTAREKGYIPDDYFVFWGYEDKYLYEIAKDELLRLSQQEQPFNLTMLTVDTHHVSGYVCDLCGNKYNEQTANVVSCADKQLGNFIEWCKKQEFFEDTVIIVSGDHPRMDTDLVDGVDYYDRTIYNCFINAQATATATKNRTFACVDMFPTILSALGYDWGQSRLGLGTDMFSGDPTLSEELGFSYFNDEICKKSKYYRSFY